MNKCYKYNATFLTVLYTCIMHLPCVDTKSSERLTALVTNKLICKDMTRLSPLHQTSSLEAFHSVIIHFAPKYVALSHQGMQCR